MLLENKTAFITGCNRGLGKAMVKEFAKNGANIIAHARKRTDEFIQFCAELSHEYSIDVKPVYFEMTDLSAMKAAVREIISSKMPVNILVNNAGITHVGLFQMTQIEKYKEIFDVNFFSQLTLTQLLLRYMARFKNGAIINMGSMAGITPSNGFSAYGISKAALMAFTKYLAVECGSLQIRVNALAPGTIKTDMLGELNQAYVEDIVNKSVLKRLGTPHEIAQVAVFLASDAASYLTGQIIQIDGGCM